MGIEPEGTNRIITEIGVSGVRYWSQMYKPPEGKEFDFEDLYDIALDMGHVLGAHVPENTIGFGYFDKNVISPHTLQLDTVIPNLPDKFLGRLKSAFEELHEGNPIYRGMNEITPTVFKVYGQVF